MIIHLKSFWPLFANHFVCIPQACDSFSKFICLQDSTFNHVHYNDDPSVAFKMTFLFCA